MEAPSDAAVGFGSVGVQNPTSKPVAAPGADPTEPGDTEVGTEGQPSEQPSENPSSIRVCLLLFSKYGTQ